MSRFSGKCDLYDSAVEIGEYDIKNIRLFISKNGRDYPIKLEEPKDLIPYYPYVPHIQHHHDGIFTAYLSDSFIDQEEREFLKRDLDWVLREYRKCKRKKVPFTIKDDSWYNKDIIKRVVEQGEKATIKGIHRPMSNYWRKELAKEMEKNGYSDHEIIRWVYPDKWYEDFDWRKDKY